MNADGLSAVSSDRQKVGPCTDRRRPITGLFNRSSAYGLLTISRLSISRVAPSLAAAKVTSGSP